MLPSVFIWLRVFVLCCKESLFCVSKRFCFMLQVFVLCDQECLFYVAKCFYVAKSVCFMLQREFALIET
jgi:hypothetical protein